MVSMGMLFAEKATIPPRQSFFPLPATAVGLCFTLPVSTADIGRLFRTRTVTTRGTSASIRVATTRTTAAAATGGLFALSKGSPNSEHKRAQDTGINIHSGNVQMNDVFIGCYSRPLDGRRICVPPEWARIFRNRGGVVAVELPSGRLALTTKEIAEKSSNTELLKAVHCKMDLRGRITIPKVFRGMFKEVKNVLLCGSIHYVEIRKK